MNEKAFLILAHGMTFAGTRFGAPGEVTAELCFTPGMPG